MIGTYIQINKFHVCVCIKAVQTKPARVGTIRRRGRLDKMTRVCAWIHIFYTVGTLTIIIILWIF